MEKMDNKKILVVDDSATMRMLISMTVRKVLTGLSVTEAVNGADAVEKLQKQDFALVLTDMNMPEMDGAQLISWIRSSGRKHVPIAVITTKGQEKDRDFGLSLGANGYLTKPVKGNELKELVLKFVAESGVQYVK